MLPSVSHDVDARVYKQGLESSNTGRRSDVIVLIEAGAFYSRKYSIVIIRSHHGYAGVTDVAYCYRLTAA